MNLLWPALLDVAFKSSLLVLAAWLAAVLLRPRPAILRSLWVGSAYGLLLITLLGGANLARWHPLPSVAVTVPATATLPPEAMAHPDIAWMTFVWLSGAFLAIAAVALAHLRLRAIVRRCSVPVAPAETLVALSASAGVRRKWKLLDGSPIPPFTCGVLTPAIVMPRGWLSWPEGLRRAVLLHELSHIRRSDVLIQNTALFACCFQWFNPFAWLALSQLRSACELAADESVLLSGVKPSEYAEVLLALAAESPRRFRAATIPFSRHPLSRRIHAILAPRPSRPVSNQRILLAAMPLLALTTFLGTLKLEVNGVARVASSTVLQPFAETLNQSPPQSAEVEAPARTGRTSNSRPSTRPASRPTRTEAAAQGTEVAEEAKTQIAPESKSAAPEQIPPVQEADLFEPPNPAFTAKSTPASEATADTSGPARTTTSSGGETTTAVTALPG